MISHYYYWLGLARHGHTLHNYVLDYRVTLRDFARIPTISCFYSKIFFREVDTSKFDFLGLFEFFHEDVTRLGTAIGSDLGVDHENKNQHEEYHNVRANIISDRGLLSDLYDPLREDIQFYEHWVNERSKRLGSRSHA
jgi:hypothetical protein